MPQRHHAANTFHNLGSRGNHMRVHSVIFAFALFTAPIASAADAPPAPPPGPAPVTGTVTSITPTMIVVKADGKDQSFALDPKVGISTSRKGTADDIKAGEFVGCTAVQGPDGKFRATEVHIFPEAMRGAGEGHYPWGNQADTTMTNGNVDTFQGVSDGHTIKVSYTDPKTKQKGETTILVPPSASVTVIEAAKLSDIKPGATVRIFASKSPDGSMVARGIQLNPPPMN
jgi:Domain of unknown function (DUF5666)